MIPNQKKSPEELAALREELGIPEAFQRLEKEAPPIEQATNQTNHEPQQATANPDDAKEQTPIVIKNQPKSHSLRKRELPLAPAVVTTGKTAIPTGRRSPVDIAESRRRAALANLSERQSDPAAYLRKITAHPALLIPAYLFAFGAVFTSWNNFHYYTPLALIAISAVLAGYIFFAKKRSRHHFAILIIIIVMTLAFGGLHYAPLFFYAT